MSGISEYWYTRKEMPEEEKSRIKGLVKGEAAGSFEIRGKKYTLLKVDGRTFRAVFIENRKYLFRGDHTAPPDENDYMDSQNFLTEDGLAGFSVTARGWLVSLFSNLETCGFAGAVRQFVTERAYKLVCIAADSEEGNGLVRFYRECYGFRKYAATINDTEIMRQYYGDEFMDTFIFHNGTPFHIFMIGKDAAGEEGEIKQFQDYFAAEAYVEETVILKREERSGEAVT